MENKQTNNIPQPSKKSFWAKLFGSKDVTPATPTSTAGIIPQEPPVTPVAVEPTVVGVVELAPATDTPVTPAMQDISIPVVPAVADSTVLTSDVTPVTTPVQNTAWSMPVAEEMPVPPTDPMVTPQVNITTPVSLPVDEYRSSAPYETPAPTQVPESTATPLETPTNTPPTPLA